MGGLIQIDEHLTPKEANFAEKHKRCCRLERAVLTKRRIKPKSRWQKMARLRVAELETLFKSRYGLCLSDDDAGRDDLEIAFHHLAFIDIPSSVNRMIGWAGRWAPWLAEEEAKQLATKITITPKKFKADSLAQLLNLKMEERTKLRIRTMGAVDATKEEREEIAKRNKVEKKRALRRARGVRPRDEYEAQSLTRMKPWKAEGISKSTWYRRNSSSHANAGERCLARAA